jgi:hypothetical protein
MLEQELKRTKQQYWEALCQRAQSHKQRKAKYRSQKEKHIDDLCDLYRKHGIFNNAMEFPSDCVEADFWAEFRSLGHSAIASRDCDCMKVVEA